MVLHLKITGRVQGVGFRAWVGRKALAFPSVTGWVRNRTGGWVELYADGKKEELEALRLLCQKGSFLSSVQSVEPLSIPVEMLPPLAPGFRVEATV